jgi:hypothetical protein
LEATNKNFTLLEHKFGGVLLEALLAQNDSPLSYGSEFKPIETLELIFKNHPSWSRMKRTLTHGSKWPLQPLGKENRKKYVEDTLNFGNHKGANKQQELLKKLITDEDSPSLFHSAKLFKSREFSSLLSTSKRRIPSMNAERSFQKTGLHMIKVGNGSRALQ